MLGITRVPNPPTVHAEGGNVPKLIHRVGKEMESEGVWATGRGASKFYGPVPELPSLF